MQEGETLREARRPRHSASAGLTREWGRLSGGTSVAYVGERIDLDFDQFPAKRVTLNDYVLVDTRLAYRLNDTIEAFGRVSNLFDANYQDVIGYATLGRTVTAGLRLRLGR